MVVDDPVEEFAVGHSGGGEGHILAPHQVVHPVHLVRIFEAGIPGALLVFTRPQPEPALQVTTQALESARRQHRLMEPAHADHDVDSGLFQGRHDSGRDVAVGDHRDPGAHLADLFHDRFVPGTVEHHHGQV